MTPGRVHYSFVVDAHGPFAYQAYLLAHSLIRLGRIEPDQITAHFVSGTHTAVEDVFRDLRLRTNRVEPFGHPYCNRLQHLDYLRGVDAQQVVLLDTDMFMVRPLELPGTDDVWGKVVDLPNPPIDMLTGIFGEAGLPLEQWTSDVDGAPTSRGNFNGGLYVIPTAQLEGISESWIRWARWSLDRIEQFGSWSDNVDQVSFSLAVAELNAPVAALPRHYNLPTHLGALSMDAPPFLLHYHRNVDDQLLLCPTGGPDVDEFVELANRAIREWRREDIGNTLFWGARYALFPELGSGVGSRGPTLRAKRETLRRIIELLRPESVVDIGGGDGASLEGLADGLVHHVSDAAPGAMQTYLERNPRAAFLRSDITDDAGFTADLAVCMDVLIHVPDRERFRRAVANILASGRTAALVSGFDRAPSAPSTLTYFHEPLIDAIEADADAVAYPVLAYNEITAYLVQRTSTSRARDVKADTLRRAMPLTPDVWGMLECVNASRRDLGFFPDHLPRCIEYPWVLGRVRDLDRARLTILDVGAGVNVLPLLFADDGHAVTTVDGHRLERIDSDRGTWNEWGFLDYSRLRQGIESVHERFEAFESSLSYDVVYSVSVIEHLPATLRRLWLSKIASLLEAGGTLLLTVDLQPASRAIWRLSDDVEVEPAGDHGSLDDLLLELANAGFSVDTIEVHDRLPLSRVGIALIAARLQQVDEANPARSTPVLAKEPVTDPAQGPVVTVLVPAYRPNERFDGMMASLVAQTYPDVLIRVSLDGDGRQESPQLPDMRGKQLEVIRQPRRLGWVGNVNALLATVTTPYFLLLMHDDQLSPRYIEAAVDVLERRREVVVAHGTVRYHGIRDGDTDVTASISGDRMARIHTFLERQPHLAGLGWRGVIRSELIAKGLRMRTRRSDGMLSNDLMALEMIVHGESEHVDGIYYDKYLDPGGLSRQYHGRSLDARSEMMADNLASLVVMLGENGFSADDKVDLAARYAEWLLTLRGSWNVVSDAEAGDDEPFAMVRPQIARFVANVAVSVAEPSPPTDGRVRRSGRTTAAAQKRPRSIRHQVRAAIRRTVMRLPAPLRGNPLFDADWYRQQYADVARSRLRPYAHFRRHGIAEGRDPNMFFDTDWYLAEYPDVRDAGLDPLDHYVRFGAGERRNPSPGFDTGAYLDRYPDVSESGMNPLLHYLRHGRAEGRSPEPRQPRGRG